MNSAFTRSLDRFYEEMAYIDDVVHVLLKGHLLLEEALTRILEQYVFHREHLEDARLTFNQKMLLGRSLCLRKNQLGDWELLSAINSLRNELAHSLNSPARQKKLQRVKEIFFRESSGFEDIKEIKEEVDVSILMYACAHCLGFLASFESDSKAFRNIVDAMDGGINSELVTRAT